MQFQSRLKVVSVVGATILAAATAGVEGAVYDTYSSAQSGFYPLTLPTTSSFVEGTEVNPDVLGGQREVAISNAAFTNYTGPFQPSVTVASGQFSLAAPSDFRAITAITYGFNTTPTFNLTADGATAFVVDVAALSVPGGATASLQFNVVSPNMPGNNATDTLRTLTISGPGVYTYNFADFNPTTDFTNVDRVDLRLRATTSGTTFAFNTFGDNVAVPEPASAGLVAAGAAVLVARRRRRSA